MPRKSSASLTVVPAGETPRPKPPKYLSREAAEVWNDVLNEFHHAAFVGSLHLFEGYVTAIALMRRYGREAESLPAGDAQKEAARSFRATSTVANALARSLRLTPRSRFDRNQKPRIATPTRKPWHLPARDDPPPKAG